MKTTEMTEQNVNTEELRAYIRSTLDAVCGEVEKDGLFSLKNPVVFDIATVNTLEGGGGIKIHLLLEGGGKIKNEKVSRIHFEATRENMKRPEALTSYTPAWVRTRWAKRP